MSKNNLDELLSLVNIQSVIGSKITLQKKGTNYWGLCPFHSDSTPSLSVSIKKGIFKCFSCGVSGNAVTFLQRLNNIPFMQALKEALSLSNVDQSIIATLNKDFKFTLNQKIMMLNKEAMKLMHSYLFMHLKDQEIAHFLNDRKLDLKTIEQFNLGYLNNQLENNFLDNLMQYCKTNFSDDIADNILSKTGLFNIDQTNHKFSVFFKNRIIFPILDKDTNVVGFSGRELTKGNVKYLNTAENVLFIKGNVLYNFYSLNSLDNVKEIILVEGYFDCITLVQNGFINTVATMGTALTKNQQKLIFSLKKLQRIILSFDNDNAGKEAFLHNLNLLLNYEQENKLNIPVYISGLHHSNNKDPDELFKNNNKKEAKTIFSNYENGLYQACVFILNKENLEFTLNQALDLLITYENDFVLYVEEAKTKLKQYVIDTCSLTSELWDRFWVTAKKHYDANKNKFTTNSLQQKKQVNRTKNNDINLISTNHFVNVLCKLIVVLNANYKAMLVLFLIYPQQILNIIQNYNQVVVKNNLLVNDLPFKNLIKQINSLNLNKLLSSLHYEQYLNLFEGYGFLPFLYLEVLDLNNYKQGDFDLNKNLLMNDNVLLEGLQSDNTWNCGKNFYLLLKQINLNDVLENNENFKNQEEMADKFFKVLDNIWKNLIAIKDLLLRINRYILKK